MGKEMGVYKIENKVNKMVYIGSTNNFERRKGEHLKDLSNGNHCNFKLQKDYNKYGEDAFIFFMIKNIDNKHLLKIEERREIELYIEIMSRKYIYNINLTPDQDFNKIDRSQMNYDSVEHSKCKYCSQKIDEISNLIYGNFRNDDFLVYMSDNTIVLLEADDSGGSVLGDFIINYCPVCGRRLYSKAKQYYNNNINNNNEEEILKLNNNNTLYPLIKFDIISDIYNDIDKNNYASLNNYIKVLNNYFSKKESEELILDFIMQEKLNMVDGRIVR